MEMVPFILSCITCFAARLCTGNLPGGLCSYLGVTEWSDPVLRSSNLFKKKSSSLPRPLLLHDAVLDRSTKPQRRQIPLDRQASKQAGGLILYMRIEQEHAENDRNLPLPCNAPAAGHGSGARPSRSWITSATDHPAPRRPDSREIEANAPKKISGFAKHSGASPRGVPQGICRARVTPRY